MRDFFKGGQEGKFSGITVVELVGKPPQISHLRIVRVERPLLPLQRKHGAFGLGRVNPDGFGLGYQLGLVFWRRRVGEGGCG